MTVTESTNSTPLSLDNQSFLITGGSTGIGFATAELLVRDGARVFITGRTQSSLDDAQRQLGDRAIALRSDVADLASLPALVGAVRARTDHLEGIFLNAGTASFQPLEEITPETFDEMFNINVRGALFTLQAFLPLLGSGSAVLFTSSIVSRVAALPASSTYAATKTALTSLGRTFAVELASRGIRVNTLSPGPVATPVIGKIGLDEAAQKSLSDQTLVKRWAGADEIARLARFLLTDDSSFIVGEEIAIDGGLQLT